MSNISLCLSGWDNFPSDLKMFSFFLQTMYINSKIFFDFIYLVGWRAIIVYIDKPYFALFSFWKYIIIIIIIIIFPVRCLSLVLYYTSISFHCKFLLDFFSTCIITPAYFFDILLLLIPLYPPSTIILAPTFIPFLRVSVKH